MIPSPLLVVSDRHGSARPLSETVRMALDGGARWIWFRDRDLGPRPRRDLACGLLALVRRYDGLLTIGGDMGLAAEIGADGVHLGGSATAADIERARTTLGARRLVGKSAHGLDEVRTAAGADYVTLSPVFATPSKPGYGPALGLEGIRAAVRHGIPVVALGGIGPREARACLGAGAAGVAVMGGLMRSADPAEDARRFLTAMGRPA